ncbi:MAG TPA: group II intron maturase-specific domain-containing protein [Edaphobacter sp.]|nr:group II intron maturase-specific domain-containing protein [Edaphobacter sp.]
MTRFKDKIREITRQAKGVSIETTVKRLATYMVGWRGYFGFCQNPRGADRPYSLGSAQAAMCALATVEDSASSQGRVAGTGSTSATGRQYSR